MADLNFAEYVAGLVEKQEKHRLSQTTSHRKMLI